MARGFDWWFYLWFVGDTPIAIASLLAGGVLDRFPKLRIAVLEAGCTWLPWFFDLMDEKYEITPREPISKFKPSEYFEDHFWATMEPEERMLRLDRSVGWRAQDHVGVRLASRRRIRGGSQKHQGCDSTPRRARSTKDFGR